MVFKRTCPSDGLIVADLREQTMNVSYCETITYKRNIMIAIKDAITDFIMHCRFEKNLSPKTQKFYTIDLTQFVEFLEQNNHDQHIQAIDKVVLKGYVQAISSFKPKTIKRKMATLKAFFNYLEFEDMIIVNPFRKMRINIKEPKQLPVVMTISEVRKIFKTVYDMGKHSKLQTPFERFVRIRNIAVIELLFATGIRVSELSGLSIENVDVHSGSIKVHGKGSKERVIQICNKETIGILKEYIKLVDSFRCDMTGSFFINRIGSQLSEQSVRSIVKNLAGSASVAKHITPHVFRHSVATLLLEEGVDIKYIQELLGHSSIVTTQIYTHVNKEKQKAILKQKHPRKYLLMEEVVHE